MTMATTTTTATAAVAAAGGGANVNVDNEGRCISHPFVQLQRLSIVTGKWKTLLDCCPLCAMDSKSSSSSSTRSECSSVCSSSIVIVGDEIKDGKNVTTTSVRIEEEKEEHCASSVVSTTSSRQQSFNRVGASSSSCRVRFQPHKDVQFTIATSTLSDDLFHLQQQQQHQQQQHRHHHRSNLQRSTSSSSLPAHFVSSGSSVCSSMSKSALKAQPRYKVCEKRMQQQLDDSEKVTTMSMDLG